MKHISKIINQKKSETDSPIEQLIYDELLLYELKSKPQYQVGYFFIDLAFPEIKLAIEADGYEFHSSKEQKERDKYRQTKLESLGWVFERFTGSFIYKNKEFIAAKIALKYFQDRLNKQQEKKAINHVVHYFAMNGDIELAFKINDAFIKENLKTTVATQS